MVGLGNPGRKYQGTRHNIGFAVVEYLAGQLRWPWHATHFQGEMASGHLQEHKVLLFRPTTYMNRSGQAVAALRHYYRLVPENLLVVCDDFQLPLGRLRFRAQGSSGGQRGLEDVLLHLGTQAVPRLRVGIGPLPPQKDPAQFVLEPFSAQEQPLVEKLIPLAAQGVQDWLKYGIQFCMNRYNGLHLEPESEGPKPSSQESP